MKTTSWSQSCFYRFGSLACTCGGLVSPCPPGHLSLSLSLSVSLSISLVEAWSARVHLVIFQLRNYFMQKRLITGIIDYILWNVSVSLVPELQMDSIIIDKRLTGVPWKCPDCGSERCPESFEMSLTDNPLNPFFSAKKTSVPELLIYEILHTKKYVCFFWHWNCRALLCEVDAD